jgi:ribosomal protein S18 acetylase RimI-like enzyme
VDSILIRPYRGPEDDAALKALPQPAGQVRPLSDGDWGWVAETGGAVAGFARIDHWDEADGTRLYLLTCHVGPAFGGRGVGRSLLAHQEEKAAAHWQAHPCTGPALLGGNAGQDQPETRALLLAAGYRVRFTLVDLARDPAGAADTELPEGLVLRPVAEADHPRIHEALRICFADSGHGQHTRTYEDYLGDLRDVDLWLIAWDGGEVAAVIINERQQDGSVDTPWVAVRPAWRRRGVARALLQRSLRLLAEQGVTKAIIRTVQENANHTVALYEEAGYRVAARHPRYAKPL